MRISDWSSDVCSSDLEVVDHAFELGAGQLQRQVLRAGGVRSDERQVDFGLLRGGKLDLRLFCSLLEALQGQLVVLEIDAVVLLELGREVLDRKSTRLNSSH